jgi:hypothetical protein
VGGETATEVAVEGFVVCEVDSRGLAVKSDATDAAFLAENGASDLVIAVGARRGGSLGESERELDPFIFHERDLFFGEVEAVKDTVECRGEDDSKKGDENDSGEEGVSGGEKFGRDGGQALAVDGALSSHEHGGFDEGILPSQSPQDMVTNNSDAQGEADQTDRHGKME